MRPTERLLVVAVAVGDRLVPKRDEIVLRTGPDFDDQGRELVRALTRAGERRITWLVNDELPTGAPPVGDCEVLPARSWAGLMAYWRARVVVHTHGVFGSIRGSRRKTFVNIWHGMPIKRLEQGSGVGLKQTDVTIATAPIHADNLASTWCLDREQVAITGLPRNDVLVSGAQCARPAALAERTEGRPLVLWLPTFRRKDGDGVAVDGVDSGTVTQLPGGTPEAVNGVMARCGAHAIVKAHPLAPRPEGACLSHLDVWSDDDLVDAGLTLYELIAQADYLITDQSSVWVDYLLVERPMVFAVADLAEYACSRGFYFSSVEDLLPGPIVTDLDGLERTLGALAAGEDAWVERRRQALELHHAHHDAGSADRVAALVVGALGGSGASD